MKKIFTATLGTETNTFASIPTGHQLFEETCLFRKGSYGKKVPMFGAPLAAAGGGARPRRSQGLAGRRKPVRLRPAGRQDGEESLRSFPGRDRRRPEGGP